MAATPAASAPLHPAQRSERYRLPAYPLRPPRACTTMRRSLRLLTATVLLGSLLGSPAAIAYQQDVGFDALEALLGAATPDGSGVAVHHIEASSADAWIPDTSHAEFAGKAFTLVDPGIPHPPVPSGHATSVGRDFYGLVSSMAPGVSDVTVYLAGHWLGSGFLRSGSAQPLTTTARVSNHSYVGADPDGILANDSNLLRRLDWVIETDDAIHAVGMNNGGGNRPLLGTSYNAIAVGRTDGNHAKGGVVLDALYGAGRTRPDLVAPRGSTSSATPVIAAAAAVLVETGATAGLSLSNGSTTNRAGSVIFNAERSETIKAALMAGADRVTNNQSTAANITDYRQAPANQTSNGLDQRYGAGQINILNSYHIISAGEQDSIEDNPAAGSIAWQGFDFDASFGGLNGSNASATYAFTADPAHAWLTAALVWNVDIDGGAPGAFDGTGTLFDLDLELWSNNGTATTADDFLFGASTGSADNSEHLWLALVAGHDYELRVEAGAGQAAFEWDYALAWQIGAAPVPLPAGVWLLATAMLLLPRLRRG